MKLGEGIGLEYNDDRSPRDVYPGFDRLDETALNQTAVFDYLNQCCEQNGGLDPADIDEMLTNAH